MHNIIFKLLVLLVFTSNILAKQNSFTVSYDPDYAPFSYVEDNQEQGLLIDIWKLWAKHNNYKITFVNGELWEDAINLARDNKVDFFLGTEVYEKWMHASNVIYQDTGQFFSLKNENAVFNKNAKLKIGIIGNDYKEDVLTYYINSNVLIYDDYKTLVQDLIDKKIDLLFDDKIAVEFYTLQNRKFHKINPIYEFTKVSNIQAISNSKSKITIFNNGFKNIPIKELKKVEQQWLVNKKDYFYSKSQIHKLEFTKDEIEFIKTHTIRTSILSNWRPISFQGKDKLNSEGISSDFWKLITNKANLTSENIFYDNYLMQIKNLQNKKSDLIFNSLEIDKTIEYGDFSKVYASFSLSIATSKNQNFIQDISFLFDKDVVVEKNSITHKLLHDSYPGMSLILSNNIEDGLNLVNDNKAFAFIDINPMLVYNIKKLGLENLKISGNTGLNFNLRFMIREDLPLLKSILNKTIDSIPKSEREAIINKWNNIHFEDKIDYSLFWYILIVFFIISLAFIYKHLTLKNLNSTLEEKVTEKTKKLLELNKNLEAQVELKSNEILEQQKLIYQQSKMASIGEMLENIAHQWRQPLNVISAASSGIKLQKELNILTNEILFDSLDNITNSSQYLSETINDFRNLLQHNKTNVNFNISKTIDKALYLVNTTIINKKIEVIKNIQHLEAYGIENEVIQVLLNLINNSIDAFESKELSHDRVIIIDVFKNANNIFIIFKDNAGGIPKDIIEKIFEPYVTTKHQSQGTGIGLYMSFKIINQHMHGNISAKNCTYTHNDVEQFGAEFTIKLPVKIKIIN